MEDIKIKNQKIENKINGDPYKMDQIPAKLFNSEYLSDVTFIVEGKHIYAHSVHLMVRSSVFEEQLASTLGEKKIIPITDYGYDVFYQLIRFIYTDQEESSDADWFPLMKLTKEYNVIKLINHLENNSFAAMKMFDVRVKEEHQIGLKSIKPGVPYMINNYLRSDTFLSMQPDAVEEILRIVQIKEDQNESYILDALVRWMNHHCTQNEIQLPECRQKFDHLFRLIRFPAMSIEELVDIRKKYPELLTKSDFMNITTHRIYGTEFDEAIWNCTPRANFIWPYKCEALYNSRPFEFSVSSNMILGGFVFGGQKVYDDKQRKISIEYKINEKYYRFSSLVENFELGTSTFVHPCIIYRIMFSDNGAMWCRKPETNLIIKAPPNTVNILRDNCYVLEILFLKPDGSNFD